MLGWVKAFLRAGILTEEGLNRETITGTPQGGILSPLLANIALSRPRRALRRQVGGARPEWTRAKRRRAGVPTMRLIRYADDFVVMVAGTRDDAEALRDEVARCSLRWAYACRKRRRGSATSTRGSTSSGWRIQRRAWRGRTGKRAIYTYPSKKTLASIIDKVRALTRRASHRTLADLLRRLNPMLRGWCNYFRHGVSSRTFNYVDHFAFWRIVGWLRKRHVGLNMHTLVRRYLPGWKISDGRDRDVPTHKRSPSSATATGAASIPTPWSSATTGSTRTSGMNTWRAGCGGSRTSGSEGGPEKPTR